MISQEQYHVSREKCITGELVCGRTELVDTSYNIETMGKIYIHSYHWLFIRIGFILVLPSMIYNHMFFNVESARFEDNNVAQT